MDDQRKLSNSIAFGANADGTSYFLQYMSSCVGGRDGSEGIDSGSPSSAKPSGMYREEIGLTVSFYALTMCTARAC